MPPAVWISLSVSSPPYLARNDTYYEVYDPEHESADRIPDGVPAFRYEVEDEMKVCLSRRVLNESLYRDAEEG